MSHTIAEANRRLREKRRIRFLPGAQKDDELLERWARLRELEAELEAMDDTVDDLRRELRKAERAADELEAERDHFGGPTLVGFLHRLEELHGFTTQADREGLLRVAWEYLGILGLVDLPRVAALTEDTLADPYKLRDALLEALGPDYRDRLLEAAPDVPLSENGRGEGPREESPPG